MRVHLVNPSDVSFGIGVITPRWLFVLAAATPQKFGEPIIHDETLERLDPSTIQKGDVVGIGVYTGNFTVPSGPLTVTQGSSTNVSAVPAITPITNGGTLWMDWWAIEPYVDQVVLTFHYWQNPALMKYIIDVFKEKGEPPGNVETIKLNYNKTGGSLRNTIKDSVKEIQDGKE